MTGLKILIEVLRVFGITTFGMLTVLAQGMCVPDPLMSSAIRGHAYFEVEGKKEALSAVKIELSTYGYDRPVLKTVTTNSEGWFEMTKIRPGHYSLTAKHAGVIGLTVEIRLKRPKKAEDGNVGIEFTLRNDPSKACGGATVKLANGMVREPVR